MLSFSFCLLAAALVRAGAAATAAVVAAVAAADISAAGAAHVGAAAIVIFAAARASLRSTAAGASLRAAATRAAGLRATNAGAVAVGRGHAADARAAAAAATAAGAAVILGREELVNRELKGREQLAGVLVLAADAVGLRAVLVGHADVEGGHQELDIALELDDRELAQRDAEQVAVGAHIERLALEAAADRRGNLGDLAAAAARRGDDLGLEENWIDNFDDSPREVAPRVELDIARILDELGGEDAGAAFAAEQDAALVENSEAVDDGRAADAGADFNRDPIEEADVHGVEAAVELDFLHVDADMQQLGAARLDGNRIVVDQRLIGRG